MSGSTLTTAAFVFKREYSDHQIADLTMRDHVWWAMINKEGGFGGDSFLYPVRYGNPQGVSGTFSRARANAASGSSKGAQFRALRTHKFGVVTIDGEAALAAQDRGPAAFFDLLTMETDNVLEEVGDSLAFDFYRDTSGLRGRVQGIVGNVLTLVDPEDARNFKEGMFVIADDTITGLSPRAGSTFVIAVNEDGGTVEVDDITDVTGSIQVNDYLFRDGDPGTCMEGLEVCTPLSAPVRGTDSFRGEDRGRNPTRLAGVRLDDATLNAEVVFGRLAVKHSKIGKSRNINQGFCNPTQFFNMAQRLNAKVEYTDGGGTANYGFQYIMIHTSAGSFKVFADPDCPMNRARTTREGSQYVKHLKGLPHVIDLDGNPMLRQNDENGIECRVEAFPNLIQDDPGANGVGSLATS
jgi:hypothetical protein